MFCLSTCLRFDRSPVVRMFPPLKRGLAWILTSRLVRTQDGNGGTSLHVRCRASELCPTSFGGWLVRLVRTGRCPTRMPPVLFPPAFFSGDPALGLEIPMVGTVLPLCQAGPCCVHDGGGSIDMFFISCIFGPCRSLFIPPRCPVPCTVVWRGMSGSSSGSASGFDPIPRIHCVGSGADPGPSPTTCPSPSPEWGHHGVGAGDGIPVDSLGSHPRDPIPPP